MLKIDITRLLPILFAAISISITACHQIDEWDNDAQGNFDALWTIVDEHYCFFEEKGIDWNEIYKKYNARLYPDMPPQMLFQVCSEMLNELKDGHVNLVSGFDTSYYTEWWSNYPQNYDNRLVEQYYLGFDCRHLGSVQFSILNENIGYINYPSFTSGLGEGNLDVLFSEFNLCTGLIIDLRDNGGGNLTYAENLARRLLREKTLAGYMINKTGPGHTDVSKPFEYYFMPVEEPHISWTKPVVVLTNRSTFSAANNFVSVVQFLPNVKIVGARTGGGSGIPLSLEIPCGWSVRMSSVSVLDAKGQTTEFGISPSEGCEIDLDPVLALQGIDTMIEKAIEVLNNWE